MTHITCGGCNWYDTRPSTNSRLSACENCGSDQLNFHGPPPEIPPHHDPPPHGPPP